MSFGSAKLRVGSLMVWGHSCAFMLTYLFRKCPGFR